MKQRGMGTWVVRAGSMNMQYKNMKVNWWSYERYLQHCCSWAWLVWME
jgi:hypothetical protein